MTKEKKQTRAEKRYNRWMQQTHLHCTNDGKFIELSREQAEKMSLEPPMSLIEREKLLKEPKQKKDKTNYGNKKDSTKDGGNTGRDKNSSKKSRQPGKKKEA